MALMLWLLTVVDPAQAATWWVATDGNDTAAGTANAPLRTIQAAIDAASGGDEINVRTGVYPEALDITTFDNNTQLVSLRAAPGQQPVLDGETISAPVAITLVNQQFVSIDGFEIRNYSAAGEWQLAAGIYVAGASSNISITNNDIHHISSSHPTSPIANGIGIYGTSVKPTGNILIDGNSVHNLILGWSESLVLNGNIDGFAVQNNVIHSNDNIGIDVIGFEQWITDGGVPMELNRARNGTITGNHIYNIDSKDNPVYGGSRSAGGIYIDGGAQVTIERNVVQNSNIGIELASESALGSTRSIDVFDNEVSGSHLAGIALGGYRADLGQAIDITIQHNTFYNNATDPTNRFGEIWLQHHVSDSTISENIVHGGSGNVLISDLNDQLKNNTLGNNLYFTDNDVGVVKMPAGENQLAMTDPRFHHADLLDLRLEAGSPAETGSLATHGTRADDLQGRPRVATVPELILPNNTWRIFSLPAAAPAQQATVRAVIGDDILAPYGGSGNGWVLFRYDATLGKYVMPGLDTPMMAGEAYWILQMTGTSVALDLPPGSRPVPRRQSTACTDSRGCFEHDLHGSETGLQWVMLGHPLNSITPTDALRVTAATGICAGSDGCTLDQSADFDGANLLYNDFWWFDGQRYISPTAALSPWYGYWAAVLPDSYEAEAKLLISR